MRGTTTHFFGRVMELNDMKINLFKTTVDINRYFTVRILFIEFGWLWIKVGIFEKEEI